MSTQTLTSRWWEAAVVVLAAHSVLVGFWASVNDRHDVVAAIIFGFLPAVLLVAGLALRNTFETPAGWMLFVGSLLAAATFWHVYNVVLAFVVILGGAGSGKIWTEHAKASAAGRNRVISAQESATTTSAG